MNLDSKMRPNDSTIRLACSFSFQKNLPFFHAISCNFSANQINFIVGENGVGKSTLLRIIQGNTTEREHIEGSIAIDGTHYNIAHKQTRRLQNNITRLVCQDYKKMLALNFTVRTNISTAQLAYYPLFTTIPHDLRYATMLQEAGIALESLVDTLSGGQQQITAVVMALQKKINILLLDEPTAALDHNNTQLVINFLNKLVKTNRLTVLCITHNQELINTCDVRYYYQLYKNTTNQRSLKKITLPSDAEQ
jgi:ABC-type lipoprotein export system ATPase subunit